MSAENRATAEVSIGVPDIITVTARLAQIMAEEVDYLTTMRVAKIDGLQKEKLFLVNALETQKKYFAKHPELIERMTLQDRDDLRAVVEVFTSVAQENHRRLLMAKQVNHKIVEAITEVVKDASHSQGYNDKGLSAAGQSGSISVTLNKKV
jgi:flagellar biosynthesis/type III secretory pathway chaperone